MGGLDRPVTFNDLLEPRFQEMLLAVLLRDRAFTARARSILKPEYFNAVVHATICEELFSYWDTYNDLPTPDTLCIMVSKAAPDPVTRAAMTAVVEAMADIADSTLPRLFISEQLVWFAQKAEAAVAVGTAARTLTEFDIEGLTRSLNLICQIPGRFLDLGIDLRAGWSQVLDDDLTPKFLTGWPTFDMAMRGGMRAGELVVIAAPMKRGKSMVLMNIGARLMKMGYNVVHYTLEMYGKDVLKRYVSLLSGIPTNNLPDNAAELQKFFNSLNVWCEGRLVIREFPPKTVNMQAINAHLTLLESETDADGRPTVWVPICDYADNVLPPDHALNLAEWAQLPEIYIEQRNVGHRHQVPFITASQTNASGFNVPTLGAQNLSGSSRKGFIVDYMWGVDQDEHDYAASRFIMNSMLARHAAKLQKTYWFTDYTTGRMDEVDLAVYSSRDPATTAVLTGKKPRPRV